jgi:hypothetical protein
MAYIATCSPINRPIIKIWYKLPCGTNTYMLKVSMIAI